MVISKAQICWLTSVVILAVGSAPAYAVDGVVLINQSNALAGNVTPGDDPGFPVVITVSGSYRLTSNLVVPDASTNAIVTQADDVTIDLNGFSIIGPTVCSGFPVTSCSPSGQGVGVSSFGHHTRVLNGNIRGMGLRGIALNLDGRVERVHVASNGNGGISAVFVNDSFAVQNGGIGISSNMVTNSFSTGNQETGITVSQLGVNNTATSNGGQGIFAICPSTVVSNSASGNKGGDIFTSGAGCTRANNTPAP